MRYLLLKYALKWLKSKPLNDSTKYQELLLLYSMYMCFLQESFNIEIAIEESSFKPLKCFRKDLITTDTIEWFKRKSVKSLTSIQIDKLDLLIGKLLEVGDLATVWCLEAVFHYKTKDSLILDGCLGLAEGEYSPSNLPQDVTQLLSDNSSLSKICYSPDSFSSSLSKMSLSTASSYSLLGDIEDTNTDENLEQKGTLQIVNSLVEIAIHSSRLVQYIYSALRIANRFGMQYKEVISMDNPLILIENGCDDLHLGKDIIILANLPADQTDFYLCSQIVKAVASSGLYFIIMLFEICAANRFFSSVHDSDEPGGNRLSPKGIKSWCKYNKHLVDPQQPPYKHRRSIPGAVLKVKIPVFQALSDRNLSIKCIH